MKRLIKNCLGLDCPDKICRNCQIGHSVEGTSPLENEIFICSYCKFPFIGNPCTAGEKLDNDWEEKILELPDFPNKEDLPLVHRNVAISFMRNLLKSEREKLINDLESNPNPDGSISPNIQHWIEKKQFQLRNKIK